MISTKDQNTLLNMWELASFFGEGQPIVFEDWAPRYGAPLKLYSRPPRRGQTTAVNDSQRSAAGKAWLRLKHAFKHSPYPVEFVKVEEEARANTFRVAIRFLPGTIRSVSKILDRVEKEKELNALFTIARKKVLDPEKNGGVIPTWVFAAVVAGVHREIPCPECTEAEGLSCQSGKHATTVHMSRIYAAMAAREEEEEEEVIA